jgi:hypothetical protein
MNRLRSVSLVVVGLGISLLAACSAGGGSVADPQQGSADISAAAAEPPAPAGAKVGNWDCGADGDGNAAIEDLSIRTTPLGASKAALEVSGPGDFIETYDYKATGAVQANGDILIKGENFKLTIAATADAKSKAHSAQLAAVGPKNAQLFAGAKINSKLSCVQQEVTKIAHEGETCGPNETSTIVCADGLTCRSNCAQGALCIVAFDRCEK